MCFIMIFSLRPGVIVLNHYSNLQPLSNLNRLSDNLNHWCAQTKEIVVVRPLSADKITLNLTRTRKSESLLYLTRWTRARPGGTHEEGPAALCWSAFVGGLHPLCWYNRRLHITLVSCTVTAWVVMLGGGNVKRGDNISGADPAPPRSLTGYLSPTIPSFSVRRLKSPGVVSL